MKLPEQHREIAHAWVDGAEIEWFNRDEECWKPKVHDHWYEHTQYRVKPTPHYIDWSHVHPQYTYMAMDITGRTWLYRKQPSCGGGEWEHPCNPSFPTVKAETFASFKAGTCDWKDSLVARPQGE